MTTRVSKTDRPALKALVSTSYGPWGLPLLVTIDMIFDFARLSGDYQRIHVDKPFAEKGPFGARIAQTQLIRSLVPRLTTHPFEIIDAVAMMEGEGVHRPRAPVREGRSIRMRERVDIAKSINGQALIKGGYQIGILEENDEIAAEGNLMLFFL